MPRKSDGEKIDELMVLTARLSERVDNLSKDMEELKSDLRESRQRLWLLVPPLVAALFSAALMAVVNYLLLRH